MTEISDTAIERDRATSPHLRGLDLFAGAGGLSCGFEWMGGVVVGGVEIDQAAAKTFAVNHPRAKVWAEDIRSLTPRQVIDEVGEIDVLMGGPMCQGVSQRGPRDPHDERNFAFWAFIDFVREIRPRWFLMENVPALASDVHNRDLAIAVFEEIESLGYQVSADVVNAAWLRVPQLRYRLLVMGSLDSKPSFPEEVGLGIAGATNEESFVTVGEAIMDLPTVQPGGGSDLMPYGLGPESPSDYALALRERATELFNHWSADTEEINLRRIRFVPEGGNWHDIPLEFLPPRFREVRPSDHTTTYRRLDRTHPAFVITTECGNVTSGAFTHPTQDRAITVREAARLQGFPDRFRFIGPRGSQYRQVGNAVPPLVAKSLLSCLVGIELASSFKGRLSAELFREYVGRRLPFVLAPRYKLLFGQSPWARAGGRTNADFALPKPSHAAVEEAIRSLTGLDYSPNVASMMESLLVAWRVEAKSEPRTIAVVNDVVEELFGVLSGESKGRLSPFRLEGESPLWQVSEGSGRKTVWNAATRQRATILFDEGTDGRRDFREGLRADALDVLLEQLPNRFVRMPDGERTQERMRPGWQAVAVLLLRNHEFEDPPASEDLREGFKELLGVDDATADTLFEDKPLVADSTGSPEWQASELSVDLRSAAAVQPATITVQPPSEVGAEPEVVVIDERTRRMLRLALRSYSAVLLVGPPGTGKGVILREMVREIRESPAAFGFERTEIPAPTTATPDESWTAFELLGGLVPRADGELHYAPGLVLDAIRDDRWLILDETNRGDMDKIFGALLTWLADEEVQVGKTSPGDDGRPVRLGWVETAASSVEPAGGVAAAAEVALGASVRYRAGREWRLLGTYNPQDAQRVFRFGQALSRRFVTVPISALTEADFAVLLDTVAASLPEEARFCIRGLYGAHLESERTALGPAVFMRMPRYVRNGLLAEAMALEESGIDPELEPTDENEASDASPGEARAVDDEPTDASDGASTAVTVADDLLGQLLSEAYVLSVGKYLSAFSDAEFDELGQRITVERKVLPEAEWSWMAQRRKEIA